MTVHVELLIGTVSASVVILIFVGIVLVILTILCLLRRKRWKKKRNTIWYSNVFSG